MLVNQSVKRVPKKFLQKWVKDIAKFAVKDIDSQRYRGKELVVAFLDEKPARALNKQYRGKNYATDVLSFESEDPSSLGELVICPQVIAEQAKEHGLTIQLELGYMVLHGFLHLLGYDHETTEDEAELMFELQDRLFDKLVAASKRK